MKHIVIIGYIALVCIVANIVSRKLKINNPITELMISCTILITSMCLFGAYLVYYK